MTGKIRVAHCIETMYTGGVEQTRLSLARGLHPDRFEQIVICTQALGDLPEQFEAAGCKVYSIGAFKKPIEWSAIRKATRVIREFKPHIIHGGVFEGVVTAAIVGRLARVPVIIGEETGDPKGRRWTGHLFFRVLAGMCHRMVAVSPFIRRYLVERLRIPASKVVLINNGAEQPALCEPADVARLRASFGIPPDRLVLTTVGRLSDEVKRVSDVIRALPDDVARDLHLVIVGTGPDEQMLRQLAAELDVADRVHFAGYQSDTAPYFAMADIFLQPSAYDAAPIAVLEAMLAGLPVIATKVGGIPDVVEEGVSALLVRPGDAPALAEAIARMAGDEALRRRFGKAGLARSMARFSEQRYLSEIEDLYRAELDRAR